LLNSTYLIAMKHHLPYAITQCCLQKVTNPSTKHLTATQPGVKPTTSQLQVQHNSAKTILEEIRSINCHMGSQRWTCPAL